ncbi:MAG: acetyl-CoA carboxylase biotin carboxyl carrier protein subunit [Ignavibacteria bacterium]
MAKKEGVVLLMNKYFINIDGAETPIEADIGQNEALFAQDGKSEFVYKFITDDLLMLRLNNKNYLVKAEHVHDGDIKNTEFILEHDSKAYRVICKNELELLTEKFAASRGDVKIKNELISPMPGAIVKINVKEGDDVKKGQVLIVLEAMKMENELKAAADCKVQKVLVEEKAPVDKNQVLIKFEV